MLFTTVHEPSELFMLFIRGIATNSLMQAKRAHVKSACKYHEQKGTLQNYRWPNRSNESKVT